MGDQTPEVLTEARRAVLAAYRDLRDWQALGEGLALTPGSRRVLHDAVAAATASARERLVEAVGRLGDAHADAETRWPTID